MLANAPLEEPKFGQTAFSLTSDLMQANPAIYWGDLLATCFVGYATLIGAILASGVVLPLILGVVSVLAFYRGVTFIHELTHMRAEEVPGFKSGWNALIGIPFLVPSFMYVGVHNLHHARARYGTEGDPEYLPLSHGTTLYLLAFTLFSALAPIGVLIRFALLTPLSVLIPPLRKITVERFSALAINPQFRRPPPPRSQKREWFVLETLACLWAWTLLAMVFTGVMTLHAFLVALAVASAVALINQIRTLASHLWDGDGHHSMSHTEQFLDSVTVPPPAMLPMLWAPVGLRYHALHHLLPRIPYHNLGRAHRRLTEVLPPDSPYHRASNESWTKVVGGLVKRIRARPRNAA